MKRLWWLQHVFMVVDCAPEDCVTGCVLSAAWCRKCGEGRLSVAASAQTQWSGCRVSSSPGSCTVLYCTVLYCTVEWPGWRISPSPGSRYNYLYLELWSRLDQRLPATNIRRPTWRSRILSTVYSFWRKCCWNILCPRWNGKCFLFFQVDNEKFTCHQLTKWACV